MSGRVLTSVFSPPCRATCGRLFPHLRTFGRASRRHPIRDLEFGECVQLKICVVGLSQPSSPLHVEQLVVDFFLIFGHLAEQAAATPIRDLGFGECVQLEI